MCTQRLQEQFVNCTCLHDCFLERFRNCHVILGYKKAQKIWPRAQKGGHCKGQEHGVDKFRHNSSGSQALWLWGPSLANCDWASQVASDQQPVPMSISFPCVALGTACFIVCTCVHLLTIKLSPFWLWQDFATQVHYWTDYREQCDMMKQKYGRYVTPELAEHMAGEELKTCQVCQTNHSVRFYFFHFRALRCSAAVDKPLRWGCERAPLLVSSMAAATGTQGQSMDVSSTVPLCFLLATGEAAQGCIPVLWGAWARTGSRWVWHSILKLWSAFNFQEGVL